MNLEETKALPRAVDYAGMVAKLLKTMETPIASAIHAALGIAGEVAEMIPAYLRDDESNAIEECGDIQFYAQGLLNLYGWTRNELGDLHPPIEDQDIFDRLMDDTPIAGCSYYAGQIIDQLKKSWAYNKGLDLVALKQNLGAFYFAFELVLKDWELTFDDIEAHNQHKLMTGPNARYKSGAYSDAAAQARADKASVH